ncbi:ABC transporter permease [Paenibacillus radicis (ex Gao et al. 2016)]|uniref:ABC transporter permease n=2 Tax=Paenibacillus radicis (ex Gao et al. 2016) TaxID=1737354 RepID=A0A917HMY8_9BACL|nr:ABC transporter permease [Paenibacillus radicis (ex Gao et al. 2016)]
MPHTITVPPEKAMLERDTRHSMRKKILKLVVYIFLTAYSIVNLFPILWMFMNSFKSDDAFSQSVLAWPKQWLFANYAEAWRVAKLGLYFSNSMIIGVLAVLFTVLLGAFASYFLARFRFKHQTKIYNYFVFGMLIPIHATLVPLFILENKLHMQNSYLSLIVPYIAFGLPITIFILVSFMKSFSKDIEESAIMDGCGPLRIFWSIILPMSMPSIATVVIINFINNWNEFSFALVLVSNPDLKTVPLGLSNFVGQYTTSYTTQMAGLTMALIPVIIVFLCLESYLVKGMTAGAVKG